MLILVGLPGAGKSRLAGRLAALGWEVVNQARPRPKKLWKDFEDLEVWVLSVLSGRLTELVVLLSVSAAPGSPWRPHLAVDGELMGTGQALVAHDVLS